MFQSESPLRSSVKRIAVVVAVLAVGAGSIVGFGTLQTANAAAKTDIKTATQCITRSDATVDDAPGGSYLERYCYLNNAQQVYGGEAPELGDPADYVGKINAGQQVVYCQISGAADPTTNNPWWALVAANRVDVDDKYDGYGYVRVQNFAQAQTSGRAADQPLLGVPDCDPAQDATWDDVDLEGTNPSLNPASPDYNSSTTATRTPAAASAATNTATTGNVGSCKESTTELNNHPSQHPGSYICNVWKESPIVWWTDGTNVETNTFGYVQTGSQNFVCQRQFTDRKNPEPNNVNTNNADGVRKNTNTWWLYTRADLDSKRVAVSATAQNKWGWVPATHITQGRNDEKVPSVPVCAKGVATNNPAKEARV